MWPMVTRSDTGSPRPFLRSISNQAAVAEGHRSLERAPPVLLIDEVDRADEEFEGYLLELLSDFQITIPEIGTIRAPNPPIVVITSNRTREVHDALKRRCVYAWIDYPDFAKERQIVAAKLPGVPAQLAEQVTSFVQELRTTDWYKAAGIPETLDRAAALVALNRATLDADTIDQTLGVLLKNQEISRGRGERTRALLARALDRGTKQAQEQLHGFAPARGQPPAVRPAAATRRPPCASQPAARCGARDRLGRRPRRDDVRATLLALLVHRHEDIDRFDAAFTLFFRDHARAASELALFSLGERPRVVLRPVPGVVSNVEIEDLTSDASEPTERAVGAYSAAGVSRTKDFADFSSAEMEDARRLLAELPWRLGMRRTRRWDQVMAPLSTSARSSGKRCRKARSSGWIFDGGERAAPYRLHRRRQRLDGALQPGADAFRLRAGPARSPR